MTNTTANGFGSIKPIVPNIVERSRLYQILDSAPQGVSWVTSPPGAGKTTLVSCYLSSKGHQSLWYSLSAADEDPANFFQWFGDNLNYMFRRREVIWPKFTFEYSLGLKVFSQRFFTELFARFNEPFVLVFDDYHNVKNADSLNQVLLSAEACLPEQGRIIVISREQCPSAFLHLEAKHKLRQITWDDISFDREESEAFLKLKGVSAKQEVNFILNQAQGWISGLVLMASQKHLLPAQAVEPEINTDNEDFQLMFSYFATEIFDCYEASIQKFLIQVSILRLIRPASAAKLCQMSESEAEGILSDLYRKHYFTNIRELDDEYYEFHPLFQEFLSVQGDKVFSVEESRAFKVKAGTILYESNQVNEAARVWISAEYWTGLSSLCVEQAQNFLGAGRNHTLLNWIKTIPEEYLSKDPWLSYWQGKCLSPYDQNMASVLFKRVYEDFKKAGNVRGQYLCLAASTNMYIFDGMDYASSDLWIKEVKELHDMHPEVPGLDLELDFVTGVLTCVLWRCGHVEDFPWVLERSQVLIEQSQDQNRLVSLAFVLIWFYLYKGDTKASKSLVEKLSKSINDDLLLPVSALKWNGILANYHYYIGGNETEVMHYANKAKELAERTGIYFVNAMISLMEIYSGLLLGDKHMSESGMSALWQLVCPGKRPEIFYYYVFGWKALAEGNYRNASSALEKTVVLAEKLGMQRTVMQGYVYFLLTLARYKQGLMTQAFQSLQQLDDIAEYTGSYLLKWKLLLAKAYGALLQQVPSLCEDMVLALKYGRENDLLRMHANISDVLSELYAAALRYDIEVDYVKRIIPVQRVQAGLQGRLLEQWPWKVRVYTLGRFRVEYEENILEFQGKQQRRPLELLKLLVANNGAEMKVRQVVEVLWPDVDFESGEKNFKTTLARLRKLIGKETVLLNDGRVSANMQLVWVDSWTVSQLTDRINTDAMRAEYNPDNFKQLTILYAGDFLKGGEVPYWILAYREMLKTQYLNAMELFAKYLLSVSNAQASITVCGLALEQDGLCEVFYRILMESYAALGEDAEVVKIFRRCQSVFSERLAIDPSTETKQLLSKLARPKT